MKIGIITIHHSCNYGACLQSFALYKYLELLGYTVEIIDLMNYTIILLNMIYILREVIKYGILHKIIASNHISYLLSDKGNESLMLPVSALKT